MADAIVNTPVHITLEQADAVLALIFRETPRCTGLRPLTGGCVSTVVEVSFEGVASPIVLKLSVEAGDQDLARQALVLDYFRAHTGFPVPRALKCDTTCSHVPFSWLALERLPGCNLGDATLSPDRHAALQREMATHVATLHQHAATCYGDIIGGQSCTSWAEWAREAALDMYRECEQGGLLSAEALERARRVIDALPEILDVDLPPVLNHVDIWSANIIVNEGRLSGFVDPGGLFAPRELDLAYLQIWGTVDQHFLDVYEAIHPRAEGYERRRAAYWLHTYLIHVWLFGRQYARPAEELLRDFPF